MRTSKWWLVAGLVLIVMGSPRSELFAQAVYGSIFGTVTDPTGAVVPNAKVMVTNLDQGVSFSTSSNSSGNYEQTHLTVGKYRVRVEAAGFQPSELKGAEVNVDAVTQVNVQLRLTTASETVTVTAEEFLLKTAKTDVSDTFTQQTLMDLPLPSRDFGRLIYLAPGVSGTGTGASSEQPQDIYRPRVSGQYWGGVSVQLDGTDNRESVLGAMVIAPNMDAISEVKITTGAYDPEFGQANQAVISVQTRAGTNDLHGSTFWYHRDDSTFARNPFTQAQPIAGTTNRFVPHTDWNLFGGSLGGPIRKNKLFYFMDYQGARQVDGGSVLARVPTAAERTGDLTDLGVKIYNPCPAGISPQTQTTNPATTCNVAPGTRMQFMGNNGTTPNVIPNALLSPQALYLLNTFIPLPNIPGVTNPAANNYQGSGTAITNSDAFDVRVDLYQSQKVHMFGRYSLQQYQQSAPGAFGSEAGGPALINGNASSFAGTSDLRNQSLAYGIDDLVRPNFLGDFRFGFFRARVLVNPNGLGSSPATAAGIPNLNLDNYYSSGMPAFILTQGSSTLGGAATAGGTGSFVFGYSLNGNNNCNCPLNEQQNQFQWVTNWTYIRGNHSIKFGADVRHHQNLRVPSDTHRSGQLTFDSLNTAGPGGGGLSLATFLLGDVSTFGRYVSNITTAAERQNRWFFYGQDTWRVTSKLTVNYGLRWEIYRPQYVNAAGNGGFVSLHTGEVVTAGQNGANLQGNIGTNLGYIAPRVGVAYQVKQRTVIRMGYGRSFDVGVFGTSFGHSVSQNLPILASQSLNPSGSGNIINYAVFNLANGPGAPPNPATLLTGQPTGPNGNPILPRGITPSILPLTSGNTMRLPIVDTWNLTVERQFGSNFAASIGYVGNKGTHVFPGSQNYNANAATIAGFDAPGVSTSLREPFNNYALLTSTLAADGLPAPPVCPACRAFGWTQSLKYFSDDASNHYNSLQARAEKRFSSGLSFQATYTWQSAFDYTNDYFFWNPKVDYGPEDGMRKQAFTAVSLYELPFGRGRKFLSRTSRPLDLLLGGWQISGNWVFESGLPFTPTYSNCGQDRDTGPCKPNLVGRVQTGLGVNNWFTVATTKLTNPARTAAIPCPATPGITAGSWQEPACGTFGNVARNSLFGPRLFNADLALSKNFAITERLRAQFRAESFNAFNHVNLGQPDASIDNGTPGKITGIAALTTMRRWQFALRLEF